ncbi:aspartate aminotransferase family protein [Roseburia sp. MSJ-14]|uniref:aspartate aminotransferase family protein n=1 Tax=Roseburia sp. MSJ-14 TaxID=2841514 RepID=UPI001C0F539F|nr:aspartate aminotransferase family protein [Roseburia sp. MSJ-14]MBU5472246.1 aspartate aminotransferase family protein [Roseburia sp. MSJ-14]
MLREELPEIITDHVPGPKAEALLKKRDEALPKALCGYTYPICIKRGEGAILEDVDGNKFLDFIGGVGVLNIGYSRPEVVEAVKEQAEKYFHCIFNVVAHEGYIELARQFDELMPCRGEKKKTFFANSGAEADENAIKVAKAYTGRHSIICFSGAFHGRTNLTMALTAKKSYALGMGPFPSGIYRAEFPYLYRAPKGYTEEEAIEYYVQKLTKLFDEAAPASDVAAILVEPIQGEGGFIPAPIEWVKAVRKICDDNGILLIADEVQCGNCRSGKYFASEYWKEAGAAPDIISTAKSMGGGVPISAITARAEIMDAVPAGTIGGTYCGNPLACASALKVLEIMKKEDYAGKAMEIGKKTMAAFNRMKETYEEVGDVRGLGAMIGIEFVKTKEGKEPYPEFVAKLIQIALQKGLMLENAGSAGNVIRFLAPLCITDEQLERGFAIFEESIKEAEEALK